MAGITATDASTTTTIDDSDILSAFVYSFGGGFEKWDSTSLTYTLNVGDSNPDGETVGTWTSELTTAIELAIADVEAISGLTFTETADAVNGTDGADIDFWYYNNPGDGSSGYSYGVAGDGVWIDEDSVYTVAANGVNGLEYGGTNYRTVIHELLHNIGVAHPHDRYANLPGVTSSSDLGDFSLNQNLYTVMSYNRTREVDDNGEETTGWPNYISTQDQSFGVLGAFDIAIIQTLYGANMATAAGDDIYDIPSVNGTGTYYKAVWDAGGTDTFRYTGTGDVRIDLRAATLDMADGMLAGGIASRVVDTNTGVIEPWGSVERIYGGYTIANGVVIENGTGGDGDDEIVGNDVANTLLGNAGKDEISGNGAADRIKGGQGKDTLKGGTGADAINGGGGADTIRGQKGKDTLKGNEGADKITGGASNDTLYGGDGADQFIYDGDSNTGTDTIGDFDNGNDLIKITGSTVFGDLTITQMGSDKHITWDSNEIILDGITGTIDASDFLFA